ncbi:MAG: hypothetical protein AAB400_02115 [Patescibacteria group bacterium]
MRKSALAKTSMAFAIFGVAIGISTFTATTPIGLPDFSVSYASTTGILHKNRNEEYLVDEAERLYSMYLMRSEVEMYKKFRIRLFANEKLAGMFKKCAQARTPLGLADSFRVYVTTLSVDVKASDEAIIAFLVKNLPTATQNRIIYDKLSKEAQGFGLTLILGDLEGYKKFRGRLLANKRLADAFREASHAGISIGLGSKFESSTTAATINIHATDEEILTFFLGD